VFKKFSLDSSKVSHITKTIPMGGRYYDIDMRWLERSNRWWIHIRDETGNLILSHPMVVYQNLLLTISPSVRPDGFLILVDVDGQGEANLRDLGFRCQLVYVDDFESESAEAETAFFEWEPIE